MTKVAISKLTADEALAELAVLVEEGVEYEEEYNEKTPVKDLRRLVKEGREALAGDDEATAEGDEEDADEEGDDEAEEEEDEDDTVKGDSVQILDKNNRVLRTYSKRVHGKEFVSLAKEFLSKAGRDGFTMKKK